MAERREVRIMIGKRHYRTETVLDNEELVRVVGIVNEVSDAIGSSIDQESLLMLTCLQLAYNLGKVSELLEPLDKRLKDLKF